MDKHSTPMRWLLAATAVAMPLVAWASQRGLFGPDNGTISDRYPTLLVAAGYAFSIWGVIFLLDLAYGLQQAAGRHRADATLGRIRPAVVIGFLLTALWMPLFSQGLFWVCLPVIFGALACLGWAALQVTRAIAAGGEGLRLAWLALSLHAGWLSLAAFLNLAQTIVAYEWLPGEWRLGWSLGLFMLAAAVLLELNRRMHGNLAYAGAALWGLAAVYVKQANWDLPGADVAAWTAAVIAAVLLMQTVWLWRGRGGRPARATGGFRAAQR